MIYALAALAALIALVVIYMARPNFTRVIQSAARFFPDSPAVAGQRQFSWSRPRPTRLFFVQLLVIVLLFLAIFAHLLPPRGAAQQIGIWVIVDRSASMSTRQSGQTRMARALAEVRRVAEQPLPIPRCFRLSAFDLGLEHVRDDAQTASELVQAAAAIAARPLGTDLALLHRTLDESRGPRPSGCRVDVVVVITDMPAPVWMDAARFAGDWWIDVSQRVPNVGFTDIDGLRDQLTGGVEALRIRVEAFGDVTETVTLVSELPNGVRRTASWEPSRNAVHVEEIKPEQPGVYRFHVSPGGAYDYDDRAEIHVPAVDEVRVDWRIGRRDLPATLGWVHEPERPDVRVVSSAPPPGDVPTIVVGNGYARGSPLHPISDFQEVSPLLVSLNLDVAERMGMAAAGALPDGFDPILRGEGGVVWVAQRQSPPAVYVPGLPLEGDDSAARFSAAVFFNAVKWVLQRRPLASLFRLTSLTDPEPRGNVIVLHPGEGDTGRTQRSIERGAVVSFAGVERAADERRLWPWVLLMAILAFAMERWLALVRGWE